MAVTGEFDLKCRLVGKVYASKYLSYVVRLQATLCRSRAFGSKIRSRESSDLGERLETSSILRPVCLPSRLS